MWGCREGVPVNGSDNPHLTIPGYECQEIYFFLLLDFSKCQAFELEYIYAILAWKALHCTSFCCTLKVHQHEKEDAMKRRNRNPLRPNSPRGAAEFDLHLARLIEQSCRACVNIDAAALTGPRDKAVRYVSADTLIQSARDYEAAVGHRVICENDLDRIKASDAAIASLERAAADGDA